MAKFGMTRVGDAATYKIKPPEDISKSSAYFTIVVDGDTPVAFFFNSKDMKSFQWITALMTAWSDMIDHEIPIEVIITAMKETFQPGGDYIIPGTKTKVNSVVHHMGLCLEDFIAKKKTPA